MNVFKKRVIIQSMHHTVFIHLYTQSFLSFSHSSNMTRKKKGKNDNFFFGRTEINLTEQKGKKKKNFFFVREIWKNVTLKYDAISDGVSYGVEEEEGMEKKKKI